MAGSKTGTTADAAKLIRADIKAAAKGGKFGTYPQGVTFGVRTESASLCSEIKVIIKGAPGDWALEDDPRGIPGLTVISGDLLELTRALKPIVRRHFQPDGSIYFAFIYLGDCRLIASC
jgi:hypothetical protein